MKKLPEDFALLPEMSRDQYFPAMLVEQMKSHLRELIACLEKGQRSHQEIQDALDRFTQQINAMQAQFEEQGSQIETAARDDIADTVEGILRYFDVSIDIEDALAQREW